MPSGTSLRLQRMSKKVPPSFSNLATTSKKRLLTRMRTLQGPGAITRKLSLVPLAGLGMTVTLRGYLRIGNGVAVMVGVMVIGVTDKVGVTVSESAKAGVGKV